MKFYNIKIFNGSNVLLYNEIIAAKDENEAVIKVLDIITLYDGDTLKINEE